MPRLQESISEVVAFGKPGPFRVVDSGCEHNCEPPRRRYSCPNYEICLNLAAALDWDSFTCRGCTGKVNQALHWQARQAKKKDLVARKICHLPEIRTSR
ncbi:MAG: hypothetical protein DCC75_00545 [Proteobacteria bacterium]|nr:MAG: hypothetical protein DCC75_00545 [Pseudomonadota bacterium]